MKVQQRIQIGDGRFLGNIRTSSIFLPACLAVLFWLWLGTSGCVVPSSHEGRFTPSPSGDVVLSEDWHYLDLAVLPAPEPISLGSSAVSRLRRTADGKQLLEIPEVAYIESPLWSHDSRWLAFPLPGCLRVCDARKGGVKTVWVGEIGSVAWTFDGRLRYVRLPDEVWQFEPVGAVNTLVLRMGFTVSKADNDPSYLRQRSRISPSGRFCAGVTPTEIVFFDLDNGKAVRSIPNPGFQKEMAFVSYLTWSHNDRFCLFQYLPPRGGAWDQPNHAARLALYDLARDSLISIDTMLPLDEAWAERCSFVLPKDCWSKDDRRFLVEVLVMQGNLPVKHILCQLEPWSALCLEDLFGGEARDVRLSSCGDFVAFTRKSEEKGIYIAEIRSSPEGILQIGQHARVWKSKTAGWFWSPTEPKIMLFRKGHFTVIDARTVTMPASRATR